MAVTEHYEIPLPDPAAEVDDEFYRLQQAWTLVDSVLWLLAQAIAEKANVNHTQAMSTVVGLVEELAGKMPANRTFSLDDLTDVNGAAGAANNYVLVKNASGQWVPSSAIAALGPHQHGAGDIVGLAAAINAAVAAVVGAAPTTLDTLNELAAALGNDPNFAATIMALLGQKAAAADVYTKAQVDAAIGAIQGVPSGFIIAGATPTAPAGWLKCNGPAISRTTYAGLFHELVTKPGYTPQAFTVSIGSPGLFSKAAHGFLGGERLRLSTNGALPTGLNTTTDYFVIFVSVDTFYLSTSDIAPVPINTSGTQSGTHTYLMSLWGLGDGVTTFNAPDLRGAFLRGMEGFGRGLDVGRSVGSFQRDAMQPITGSAGGTLPGAANGAFFYFGAATDSWSRGGGSGTATASRVDFDSSRQVRTAAETRPVNVSLHYFIKI
jgi:microcystin-dependent protein